MKLSSASISAPLSHESLPGLLWIEVATSLQIPHFQIIGLPGPEVEEARERIRAAIETSGFEFPRRRVVLNLSPSSIRKHGTGLDLAMALAVLASSNESKPERSFSAWGELGLDGVVKPAGQLTRAIYGCWKNQIPHLLLSTAEHDEAQVRLKWIAESGELKGPPPELVPVSTFKEAWGWVTDGRSPKAPSPVPGLRSQTVSESSQRRLGQNLLPLSASLQRAICVAAAGAHHLLLLGPRGTGKTHALDWLIALQPPLSPLLKIRNLLLAELTHDSGHDLNPQGSHASPIRRIGPQNRPSALTGHATRAVLRPGEFSLSHGGLLIADEFPEWPRDSREALREPMERGWITLTRATGSIELPAQFVLAANGNFCPCGGWPNEIPLPPQKSSGDRAPPRCRCQPKTKENYLNRIRGPVLDRIDLVVMTRGFQEVTHDRAESLELLSSRVACIRQTAIQRWGTATGSIPPAELENLLRTHRQWLKWLSELAPSNLRSRHKLIRIALSLSLWDGAELPTFSHFLEASCFRAERLGLLD